MAKKKFKQIDETPMQVQEPVIEYQRTKPAETKNVPGQNKGLNAAQLHFLQTLEFVKTEELIAMFHTLDFDPNYDYKAMRK